MEPIDVYGVITNGGDGSASLRLFITEEAASEQLRREEDYEGFTDNGIITINTYVNSKTHIEAIEHEKEVRLDWADDEWWERTLNDNDKIEEDDY